MYRYSIVLQEWALKLSHARRILRCNEHNRLVNLFVTEERQITECQNSKRVNPTAHNTLIFVSSQLGQLRHVLSSLGNFGFSKLSAFKFLW